MPDLRLIAPVFTAIGKSISITSSNRCKLRGDRVPEMMVETAAVETEGDAVVIAHRPSIGAMAATVVSATEQTTAVGKAMGEPLGKIGTTVQTRGRKTRAVEGPIARVQAVRQEEVAAREIEVATRAAITAVGAVAHRALPAVDRSGINFRQNFSTRPTLRSTLRCPLSGRSCHPSPGLAVEAPSLGSLRCRWRRSRPAR